MSTPGAVFVLGGPTAAGKSDLALELAERFDAVVVSADAMTVYRGLDVGTAKPSAEDRARAPHFGLDLRELWEDFSVADFVAEVRRVTAAHPRVIVAGGTPFYLRALTDPLAALPPASPALRAELEALDDLHGRLAAVDPESAARLHPNDRVRLVRALEVHRLTGQTLTALHARGARTPPLADAVAWLDRDDLRDRIDRRIDGMLARGYLDEARWARSRAAGRPSRPLRSFSYKHLLDHLSGAVALEEAVRCTARDTWRFARKQRTFARGRGWQPLARGAVMARAAATFDAGEGRGEARSP